MWCSNFSVKPAPMRGTHVHNDFGIMMRDVLQTPRKCVYLSPCVFVNFDAFAILLELDEHLAGNMEGHFVEIFGTSREHHANRNSGHRSRLFQSCHAVTCSAIRDFA